MPSLLVVEDDILLQNQLKKSLQTRFEVTTCSTVSEANRELKERPFDGLVIDFLLPDGKASKILQSLTVLDKKPVIVIMTAYAEKDMAIECINFGVNGFIEKPFMRDDLLALLSKHIQVQDIPADIKISHAKRSVEIKNISYSLTDIELNIFHYFLTHSDQWISRKQLVAMLWGENSLSRNTLDTHLLNLKNKIPAFKNSVENIRGRGYLLNKAKLNE